MEEIKSLIYRLWLCGLSTSKMSPRTSFHEAKELTNNIDKLTGG